MSLINLKIVSGRRRQLVLAACAVLAAGGLLLPGSGSAAAQGCPAGSNGATAPTTVSAEDQATILQLHNQYRNEVGVPALTWDDSLAAAAQGWTDIFVPAGQLCHDPNRGDQGENLADYGSIATGVQGWYGEKGAYDNDPDKVVHSNAQPGTNWQQWGHYSQMVWRDTQRIGCGAAPSKQFAGNIVLDCRYSPPGNFDGQTAY